MMQFDKTLETFKDKCFRNQFHQICSKDECKGCMNNAVIVALERQIAKKPLKVLHASENDYFKCRTCGGIVGCYEHHCRCGQKQDWSGEDE